MIPCRANFVLSLLTKQESIIDTNIQLLVTRNAWPIINPVDNIIPAVVVILLSENDNTRRFSYNALAFMHERYIQTQKAAIHVCVVVWHGLSHHKHQRITVFTSIELMSQSSIGERCFCMSMGINGSYPAARNLSASVPVDQFVHGCCLDVDCLLDQQI